MKLFIKYFVFFAASIVFINVNVVAQIYTTTKVDAQVKELVTKMTLEEKIGQMTQVTIQAVSKVQGTKDQNHQLDLAKLEEAIPYVFPDMKKIKPATTKKVIKTKKKK